MKVDSEQYAIKKSMIDEYRDHYGIYLSHEEEEKLFNQLDDVGLEMMMKKKLSEKKQYIAAVTLQSRFRGFMCRKWYARVHHIRTLVATKLQRLWRRYYRQIVIPRE